MFTVEVFLALSEMKRAKVRFGLLMGAVGLLVFLILFQQALLSGLVNQFIGALKNQSASVLVYSDQARQNLEGSRILPPQQMALAGLAGTNGIDQVGPLGQGTFTVTPGGSDEQKDAVIFGYELGGPGAPTTLSSGRLPEADDEAVASSKDRDDGFGIGDVVRIEPDGVEITIVGLADDINYSVAPTMFASFATYEAAKRTRSPEATTVLPSAMAVTLSAGSSANDVVAVINSTVDGVEALTRQEAVDKSPGVGSVKQSFAIILTLFYLVVPLVTGLFFLIVTFQKAPALTLLRAIGASSGVLVRSLVVQVFVVVALGGVVATILFAFAAQGVQNLGIRVEPRPVLTTVAIVLVLALATSIAAIRRVLRIDPIEATTGAGVKI